MRKRGELLGMPFIMMFALIVGALTLAGGLYYVFKLLPLAERISIDKEINDFKTVVESHYYSGEIGDIKKVKIQFPSKVLNVCFFDINKYNAEGWKPGTGNDYPPDFITKKDFYEKFFASNTERNMFLFPSKELKESAFYIPYLNLQSHPNNPTCVKNGQTIRLIGMGSHVEIKAE